MNSMYRWVVLSSTAAALVLVATAAPAFTDSNAELKEASAYRPDRVVVVAKAAPPKPTLYVPLASARQLDSFKPVLPPERRVAESRPRAQQTLAKADAQR
jgi:hypothetical protein